MIRWLALVATPILCLASAGATLAQDASDVRRSLFEDCALAHSQVRVISDQEKDQFITSLGALLRLPVHSLDAPIALTPLGGTSYAPKIPLSGAASEVWVFSPSREMDAKRCALEILPKLVPRSLAVIPDLILVAADPSQPMDIRDMAEETAIALAAHVGRICVPHAGRNERECREGEVGGNGPALESFREIVPLDHIFGLLGGPTDTLARAVLLELNPLSYGAAVIRLKSLIARQREPLAEDGRIWSSGSLPEFQALASLLGGSGPSGDSIATLLADLLVQAHPDWESAIMDEILKVAKDVPVSVAPFIAALRKGLSGKESELQRFLSTAVQDTRVQVLFDLSMDDMQWLLARVADIATVPRATYAAIVARSLRDEKHSALIRTELARWDITSRPDLAAPYVLIAPELLVHCPLECRDISRRLLEFVFENDVTLRVKAIEAVVRSEGASKRVIDAFTRLLAAARRDADSERGAFTIHAVLEALQFQSLGAGARPFLESAADVLLGSLDAMNIVGPLPTEREQLRRRMQESASCSWLSSPLSLSRSVCSSGAILRNNRAVSGALVARLVKARERLSVEGRVVASELVLALEVSDAQRASMLVDLGDIDDVTIRAWMEGVMRRIPGNGRAVREKILSRKNSWACIPAMEAALELNEPVSVEALRSVLQQLGTATDVQCRHALTIQSRALVAKLVPAALMAEEGNIIPQCFPRFLRAHAEDLESIEHEIPVWLDAVEIVAAANPALVDWFREMLEHATHDLVIEREAEEIGSIAAAGAVVTALGRMGRIGVPIDTQGAIIQPWLTLKDGAVAVRVVEEAANLALARESIVPTLVDRLKSDVEDPPLLRAALVGAVASLAPERVDMQAEVREYVRSRCAERGCDAYFDRLLPFGLVPVIEGLLRGGDSPERAILMRSLGRAAGAVSAEGVGAALASLDSRLLDERYEAFIALLRMKRSDPRLVMALRRILISRKFESLRSEQDIGSELIPLLAQIGQDPYGSLEYSRCQELLSRLEQ